MAKIQSVEPNIADLANGWLKSYKRDYKLEQESLNTEIDQALNDYYSKNGGVGGNRPDAKLLLQDKNLVNYPILIEYKGYKDIAVVHTENLPKYASIFVTTAIHKSSHNGQFDYGHNFYAKDADALYISLPVNEAGNPDYDKMAIIISAIHKLVIKDVVAYSNRKIKATKAVVK